MKFEFVDEVEKGGYSAKIKVLGVGGAGGNAINNMINSDLRGVDFIVANTDAQ
ncbi:MAG: cell division protein FtsZ, partial [Candidatus Desulfacyla sp.]